MKPQNFDSRLFRMALRRLPRSWILILMILVVLVAKWPDAGARPVLAFLSIAGFGVLFGWQVRGAYESIREEANDAVKA